ncbi:MAG: energy transducer TonB [Bacteroidales bacterium]|jgi:protein TonB|nr:energy transducer TonB [Bacteroidales bacterium]
MDIKKNKKADLENKKSVFLQLGLVVTLAVILIAFEWTTTEKKDNAFASLQEEVLEEEQVPITEEPEPPQETPPEVNVTDIFEIVDNDIKIENEILFNDLVTEDTQVAMITFNPVVQEEEKKDDVFMIVEDMPTFRGGDVQKFSNWVKERVKYPQIAQENGIQGKVFIGFIVEPDGSVSNVTVLRSVDKSLDDEAVRVVESSPKWAPGKQRGQPVRVRFSITVNFQLQ